MPGAGVAIDGARENLAISCAVEPSPAIFANHSPRPNAVLEHWPATEGAGPSDRLVIVAHEVIRAGMEVRSAPLAE